MKNSRIILGIVIGFGLFSLISASSKQTSSEGESRYYMELMSGSVHAFIYDSVTGEYRKVYYNHLMKGNNIKTLLNEKKK